MKAHDGTVLEEFTYETPHGGGQKRLKTAKLPAGATETYVYNTQDGTVATAAGSRSSATWFDKALYPVQIIDAEGGQQHFEYNLDGGLNRYGEVKAATDRDGNTTFYNYDSRGNVVETINPDMSSKTFAYDQDDNMENETDELGNKTFYHYDDKHNLLARIRPLDGASAYSELADQSLYSIERRAYYTPTEAAAMCGRPIGGLLKSTTDAAGGTTAYTYDACGNMATCTDPLGRTTTYSFNVLGWLKQQSTPMGYATSFYYDKCGRLVKKTDHGGGAERWVYDYAGNLVQGVSPKQYAAIVDAATYTAENIISVQAALPNTVGHRWTYTLLKRQKTRLATSRSTPTTILATWCRSSCKTAQPTPTAMTT